MFVGKLGTFVALGVRGVESLRIGVITWVSFMLKWVKQIAICTILELNTNCHQCCSVARSLLVE